MFFLGPPYILFSTSYSTDQCIHHIVYMCVYKQTRLSFETIKADIESECLTICRRPQLGQEQKKKLKSLVKFWLDNSDYWAGYRRTYHLITQQVTTTNYNEGLHKCYKKNRPLTRRKQTNAGDAILGVITVQSTQFQNNRFLVVQAENKVTPLHKLYDRFIEFPVGNYKNNILIFIKA